MDHNLLSLSKNFKKSKKSNTLAIFEDKTLNDSFNKNQNNDFNLEESIQKQKNLKYPKKHSRRKLLKKPKSYLKKIDLKPSSNSIWAF